MPRKLKFGLEPWLWTLTWIASAPPRPIMSATNESAVVPVGRKTSIWLVDCWYGPEARLWARMVLTAGDVWAPRLD
jgi:hypothetical protein